jgi:hypothetical protein
MVGLVEYTKQKRSQHNQLDEKYNSLYLSNMQNF